MMKAKILIVDDEKPLRDMLAKWFRPLYECLTAPDGEQALAMVAEHPDLALMITDFKMPGLSGIELARAAKAANPALAVVMLTAHADVGLVIEALRDGVDDFFQKPVTDLRLFEERVAKAIGKARLDREVSDDRAPADEIAGFTGGSPAMEKVYRLIRKVAPTNATVLVQGPSGSGKELVARALHRLSNRAGGPFVAVECAALPKELLASELFGYAPGTFTGGLKDGKAGCFEAAAGGTLFLDEIGEIDADTQVKLLRTLESRTVMRLGSTEAVPVDFRLVSATNKDLLKLVVGGGFREDLYYRLNVIDIRTPALKDHPEDIAPLAARFIREAAAANGAAVTGIDADALKALEAYPWPGNVRQLRNIVEKMVVLASGSRLTAEDLPDELTRPSAAAVADAAPPPDVPASPLSLAETEKQQILAALEACGNNKSRAAERLGISRRTLHRKLNEWKVEP